MCVCVCVFVCTHGGLLALDAGAVEAQGGDAVGLALDMEDALVVPLARLGLRQVACGQRDGFGHPHRDVDLAGRDDLRTVLKDGRGEREIIIINVVIWLQYIWKQSSQQSPFDLKWIERERERRERKREREEERERWLVILM